MKPRGLAFVESVAAVMVMLGVFLAVDFHDNLAVRIIAGTLIVFGVRLAIDVARSEK